MRCLTFALLLVLSANCGGQTIFSGSVYLFHPFLNSDIDKADTKHRIKKGDTYISLSRKYYATDKYWKAIKAYNNNLPADSLKPGEFLKIPSDPLKHLKGSAKPEEANKVKEDKEVKKKSKFETVGDIYNFLKKKLVGLLVNMKLDSTKELTASISVIIAILIYLFADFILLLPSFPLLRMQDNNPVRNSAKLTLGSFTIQVAVITCIGLIGYLVVDNSDSWSADTILKTELSSSAFMYTTALLSLICYLVIPFICVKTMFDLSNFKSVSIVTLPFLFKTVVSVFPVFITYLVTDFSQG